MGIAGYIGLILIALAIILALFATRRFRLLREGGVHVALRSRVDDNGRGWQLGVGRYRGDDFIWFRALSIRSGPDRIIPRVGLEVSDRREPSVPESYAMPVDAIVLRCRGTAGEMEIAMGSDAVTGFLSWLESSPPGRAVPWAS
ncbi:MAG TPA: DUF2550 domain-containing protein [Pseudonocardiaceae bacterium]|nr:DUF2550 domain-containing protein [Pseudonocardiaceae bacterium]